MIDTRLIATQGLGGGSRMIAMMGIMPAPRARDPGYPFTPVAYVGADFARFRQDDETYDIPLHLGPDDDEEAVVLTLMMEFAAYVL